MARVGIIGGTGLYNLDMLSGAEEKVINTVYGDATVVLGTFAGRDVVFVSRHGKYHTLPPHLINYRANIRALHDLRVDRIFATASVGSLNLKMKPKHLVVLDQFIDFTKIRPLTFFEGGHSEVVHVDMTSPYCSELREIIFENSQNEITAVVHPSAVYICTEGPRFETAAEIEMFKNLGGDLVGMTNIPEVILARELGICYSAVGIVTNYAAGISASPLSHSEVIASMSESIRDIEELFESAISKVPDEKSCDCQNAVS